MRVPWEKIPWEKSGNIAQIAVALIALITFTYTAYQSSRTAEFLAYARDAFVTQSFPVVKFDTYQWYASPGFNCANPTLGINVYYRNFTGVPVVIEETNLNVKMGDRPLFIGPGEIEEPAREAILPPGVALATAKIGSPIWETYPRLQGHGIPPYMNFELTIIYRSLISGMRYRYIGKVTMHEDCRLPDQRRWALAGETLTEIPAQN
jgi:hypothetical protein